jgi:toxin ParE1/3/4
VSRRIVIRPQADRDIDEIADYLDQQRMGLGQRFHEATARGFRQLAKVPTLGMPRKPPRPDLAGLRCATVPGFRRHVIIYLPTPNTIEIIRVLHGARDLEYILGGDPD